MHRQWLGQYSRKEWDIMGCISTLVHRVWAEPHREDVLLWGYRSVAEWEFILQSKVAILDLRFRARMGMRSFSEKISEPRIHWATISPSFVLGHQENFPRLWERDYAMAIKICASGASDHAIACGGATVLPGLIKCSPWLVWLWWSVQASFQLL